MVLGRAQVFVDWAIVDHMRSSNSSLKKTSGFPSGSSIGVLHVSRKGP